MKRNSWFEVDKEGLRKLQGRQGTRAFLIYELIQNAWDEATTQVTAKLTYEKKLKVACLTVEDDNPEGFRDLSHAYTLFAESSKKSDPEKRGRFNIGEKLILACSRTALVQTTKGTIVFRPDGVRETHPDKRAKGSMIAATIEMKQKEFDEIVKLVEKLIPPENVKTIFNDKVLQRPKEIKSFYASLPTEICDDEGRLKPTERKTKIVIYEPKDDFKAAIYEMGIPVVDLAEDKFWIDVQQKVPLNMDRTNVTPGYLRKLRTVVLNNTWDILQKDEASDTWVTEASSNKDCSKKAIHKVMDLKFGEKRVSYDPSDKEANSLAFSKGMNVVAGGALSKGQWDNAREAEAIKPAGQITPSPKPYSADGDPLILIPEAEWTPAMNKVVKFIQTVGSRIAGQEVNVQIANDPGLKTSATCGPDANMVLNKQHLWNKWFEVFPSNMENVVSLMIHELGHIYSSDHLSSRYHEALTMLAGRITVLALNEPELFRDGGK